ncbi:MAG TPA: DUF72 domain-containing protein [Acidisarcina sp.]
MPGKVSIGISGWTYKPWRGVFYPPKLPHKRELQYASSQFDTVEINGTFYGLQRPSSFETWATETPDNFVFAVKASRFITHMLRLRNIQVPLANFFASGPLKLGRKLGPILWQFPPNFRFDATLFERFLQLLPSTMESAADLARLHDARLKDRFFIEVPEGVNPDARLRHAVEIRNETFVIPAFTDLLRRYNVALVCADAVEWPLLMDVTADFVYCRLHGSEQLYVSGYDSDALDQWAARVYAWATGTGRADGRYADSDRSTSSTQRDVFVYFDNDAKVRAPVDAKGLKSRIDRLLHYKQRSTSR